MLVTALSVVWLCNETSSAATPIVLNPDGAWCWFQDERAIIYRDKLSVGSISSAGDVQVTTWDFRKGLLGIATLHSKFQIDDHDVPGLVIRHDGRLMAFYTAHGGPKGNNSMLWKKRWFKKSPNSSNVRGASRNPW